MFDKLKNAEIKFEEINQKLMDPDIISDNEQYKNLMKEYKTLSPLIEKYREYVKAQNNFQEAKELLDNGGLDKDFKEVVQDEYDENKSKMEELTNEIRILLLPTDPNDEKNVIVEIRGGAGGEEAALFANSLFRMYSMYAEAKGWKTEILNLNATELGGIKEISFSIEGEGAYSRLRAVFTACSAFRKPNQAAEFILPPLLWQYCRKRKKWNLKSTRLTYKLTPTVPEEPADSTSIKPNPPFVSPIFLPA